MIHICFLLPIFSFSCACGEKKNEVQKNKRLQFDYFYFSKPSKIDISLFPTISENLFLSRVRICYWQYAR